MIREMVVAPVVLEGQHIRLEPLQKNHLAGLAAVGLDPELWRWIPRPVRTIDEMAGYIETALREKEQGASLPFALVERQTGRPIGSTRYGNIERINRRVEIGWTWVTREWQRTAANTEAKYLLLKQAFETLGCKVDGLRTDNFNFASQRAIERLGAKKDGVIRHHAQRRDGSVRDTVIYSVLASEWPDVKKNLLLRLARHDDSPR